MLISSYKRFFFEIFYHDKTVENFSQKGSSEGQLNARVGWNDAN